MKTLYFTLSSLVLVLSSAAASAGALSVKHTVGAPADFPVVVNGHAAEIFVDKADAEVVRLAADLLAGDIQRVSGVKPKAGDSSPSERDAPIIVIGTVGKSGLIADLIKRGKLDAKGIGDQWETFVIETVAAPFPNVPSALVIAGSDRRGAAYGALSISEAIGVSPWEWWADVAPQPRKELVVSAENHMEGPPSVKYRGIFLNDEDWGLLPWATKTFEPERKNIGPKTYAKVCELLLRLKANYLWPAMHDRTKAFNFFPENKLVADRYGIVMGSSHCEQMLRNNVAEWPKDQKDNWDPVTNLPAIGDYWEQRVRENGKFENVYTVGMRGIHDGAMPGGGTIPEKRVRLENIIELQRGLLAKHVNPDPAQVPQIFCPYKEVLDIYQDGMKLPGDITIVWPDDNYGYIRQLSNTEERKRSGGSGIYYHLSYLGRPHPYLWLDSTAPALVWHEMTKAYELGAQQLWVVNVGDIKPIEAGMTLFLQMAWDIKRYGADVQSVFLRDFYSEQFGAQPGGEIAKIMDGYFRLCALRRPDHMGFNKWVKDPVNNSYWSHAPENDEAQQVLDRWLGLARRAEEIAGKLPPESRAAYFQLVEYPVFAGAAMAEKIIAAEKARLFGSTELATRAEAAFKRIQQLTERYNAENSGKWRGMMDYRPNKLPVFHQPLTATPAADKPKDGEKPAQDRKNQILIDMTKFANSQDRNGVGWRVIEGLGPRGRALAVLPHKDTPTLREPKQVREGAPVAEYSVQIAQAGETVITVEALPTHPLTPGHEILAAVSIDSGDPVLLHFDKGEDDENDPTWQANVLRSVMTGKVTMHVPAGLCTLKLWAADPGVVVHGITVTPLSKP